MADNIEIVRLFELAFRAGDQRTIDQLCAPGLVDHNAPPNHAPNLAGFKEKVAEMLSMFPDLEEDLEDITGSGDTIATRWTLRGSLQQDFMGIPARGQKITVEGTGGGERHKGDPRRGGRSRRADGRLLRRAEPGTHDVRAGPAHGR